MKKKRNLGLVWCLLFAIMVSMLVPVETLETYQAAQSYTNAKKFYDSTGQKNDKHIECFNGMVYFATKAKAATSSTALKYTSVGFDVTLTGGGQKLTFAVKRGGSLTELTDAKVSEDYNYRLYCITTEDLHTLASKVNKTAADAIFTSDKFDVRMDAIMTLRQNDVDYGAIKENGDGTITVVRTPVYRLNKTSDLNALKSKFSNEFKSFIDISAPLTNYKNTVYYSVGDGVTMASGYTAKPYTLSGTTINNVLHKGSGVYSENYKTLQRFHLPNTGSTGLNLKKTGYHLGDDLGGSVWKKSSGETFSITRDYGPKDLHKNAGIKDTITFLYANWNPNTYTIHYDANGGTSVVNDTSMVYDKAGNLKTNTFRKDGYYIDPKKAWNTKPDGTGTSYANGEEVINMTTEHNATITLYANWQPIVAQITLDKQGGSGGTDAYFQKYGLGFYTTDACTALLNKVTAPLRTGYDFMGYYTSLNGMGGHIISAFGDYLVENTYFKNNATIYADWNAKTYLVTFDKQGGRYGSDSVIATYGQNYPSADAPEKPGFRFMGYYTDLNDPDTLVYNEFMSSSELFEKTEPVTLYAYWVDDILPVVNLNVSNDKWTNREVTVTAEASDFGSGLDSVQIYRIETDGTETPVASALNLNGATAKELSFVNTTEGVVRYKAVATDRKGKVAESINVVYYDITPPTGEIVNKEVNGNNFYFDIDITDINTGN